ncbi:MAG: hypothetical protein JNK15_00635 [Planctomycetes bacterium]|nr:hypothetical protein [Planctomycetota bacterium]
MKARPRSATSLVALLPFVAVGALPAQRPADPLQVLRTMEVEGVAAFSRDRIAGALVLDGELMRELRRPLDADVAAAVAERVRELHRRGGYLQCKAHAAVEAGVVHVHLEAGPRSVCGAIQFEGNTAVPTARLRELLAASGSDKAVWTEGGFPVVATEVLQRRVEAAVVAAYRDAGRHGVLVDAELLPEANTIGLRVRVADEGHEVRVQRLQIEGDDTAAAAVLAEVAFTPGSLATTEWLTAMQRQIERSGRYFEVRPVMAATTRARPDPLVFAVKVRPNAPAPGTLAPRDVAQVQAMGDKLLADLRAGRGLRVQGDVRDGDVAPFLRVLPGPVSFALDNRGVLLAAERTTWGEGEPVRAAVRFASDALTVELGDQVMQWRFGEALGAQITVYTNFNPAGEAEFRWGIGLGGQSSELLVATIHPATAAHLLTRATAIHRDGDVLVVEFPLTTLRIAADGSIVGDAIEITADDRKLQLGWSKERLDKTPSRPTDTVQGASAAGMVFDCFSRLVKAQLSATTAPRVRAAVLAAIDAAATLPRTASSERDTVDVPSLAEGNQSMDRIVLATAGRIVVDRRLSGELVAVASAFAAMVRGDSTAGAHFQAIADRETAGPLVLGGMSRLLGLVGNARAAAVFGELAGKRCSFAAFYRDAADLAANLPALAAVPAHLGAAWRRVPELQELLAGLPAGADGDLAAWQKVLEMLWQNGGEQWLRGALLGQ